MKRNQKPLYIAMKSRAGEVNIVFPGTGRIYSIQVFSCCTPQWIKRREGRKLRNAPTKTFGSARSKQSSPQTQASLTDFGFSLMKRNNLLTQGPMQDCWVSGVIDQLEINEEGLIQISEQKTRFQPSLPSDSQKRTTALQVMIYRYPTCAPYKVETAA